MLCTGSDAHPHRQPRTAAADVGQVSSQRHHPAAPAPHYVPPWPGHRPPLPAPPGRPPPCPTSSRAYCGPSPTESNPCYPPLQADRRPAVSIVRFCGISCAQSPPPRPPAIRCAENQRLKSCEEAVSSVRPVHAPRSMWRFCAATTSRPAPSARSAPCGGRSGTS